MTQKSSGIPSAPTHASGIEQRGQQTDTAAGKLADKAAASAADGEGFPSNDELRKQAVRLLHEENVDVEDMLRTSPPVRKVKRE